MTDSDRSRSPAPGRNRADPHERSPPQLRPDLPFFPRWRGPMQASLQQAQNMSRPQFRPQMMMNQSGAYMNWSMFNPNWPGQQFPPAPPTTIPASPPPTLPYPRPPRPAHSPCSPTLPCPPTQPCSPSAPSVPSSQPRRFDSPSGTPQKGKDNQAALRTYGFDPNPHWQEDQDHYDNQKVSGLTFPKSIRQSAFTQKLDIEGCDPLCLPLAALLYQQANSFWLRKLAHGREPYIIPTGDIAAVVFMTELLTQLRAKDIDLDKVSHSRARQDGKMMDKTNNTKYAAQQIADIIHSWVPTRMADPGTQHELTQLRSQLALLRQKVGESPDDVTSSPAPGPSASSPAATPIQRALLNNSNHPSPPAPPKIT